MRTRNILRAPKATMLYTCILLGWSAAGHAQQPAQAPQQQAKAAAIGSNFNAEFLSVGGDQAHADLSIFAFGNQVLPGDYVVEVFLDERALGKSNVRFAAQEGQRDAVACLTRELLDSWGVNVQVFPAIASAAADACVDLAAVIPDAKVSYDGGKQSLHLSIPQAALKRSARGAVDPARWDRGITAGMLDYQVNYASHSGGNTVNPYTVGAQPQSAFDTSFGAPTQQPERNSLYAGLRLGANIGDWRFRQQSNYSQSIDGHGRWQAINTYAARDLNSIKGQLLIGDGTTPGNFFDSVQFRGVQISSDDAMLPDSLQGYAPTIRGVAQTNARVTVRQNGYIIYSTFVAPGPFVIDDLYPTASSGDLEVTISEADGRQTRYTQAFSAVPTLLREGAWRYSATAGKYRNGYYAGGPAFGKTLGQSDPVFAQGTIARGLGDEFTVYGGFTAANMYQSVLAGVGKNLKDFGAVSADVTAARTNVDATNSSYNGQSVRFLYAKSFIGSGTNFRVAGYRYSTSGFRTFSEAVEMQDFASGTPFTSRRNELRFDISQQLGDWGSVFASARQQSYWGTGRKEQLVQLGYSGSYKQFSYNIFYTQSSNLFGPSNRQVSFSVSIPLGDTRAYGQYSATRGSNGALNQQASVYGSALEDSRLSYNVSAGNSNQDGAFGSASASYLSQVGRFDASYSNGRNYGQATVGLAGGVVVHSGGITLSQPLGETIALVEAPKAEGVGFEAQPGVSTNSSGIAVIPGLSPYRTNRLALRTADLGDNVDVKNAVVEVVPRRGAVVLAKFDTSVGYRLMLTLANAKGQPLPFGARVEDGWGKEIGVVGPEGQAFVSGAEQSGQLNVVWGHGQAERCSVAYSLPAVDNEPPIREVNAQCAAPEKVASAKEKLQ